MKDVKEEEDKELKEIIFVVQEDNKVKAIEVTTGIQDDSNIEILSGAESGMQVVTAPYSEISRFLKDGERITVVDKEDLFDKKD